MDHPRDYPNDPATDFANDREPAEPGFAVAEPEAPVDDQRSIGELLKDLAAEAKLLARQEVDLVRAETNEALDDLKKAAGAAIVAAVVGMAALGVLLMALAYLLAEAMELWLATLIVAIGALIIAAILASIARKKASAVNLAPTRTQHTLERQKDMANEAIHSDHSEAHR